MVSAYFLTQFVQNINDFFSSNSKYSTYYISNAELLNATCQLQLYKILKYKRISILDPIENTWSQVRFQNRLIILSASKIDTLSRSLLDEIPIQVNLGQYSAAEIFQILKQRVCFLNWSVSSDELLSSIAQVSGGEVRKGIELLRMSYFVMRSKGEDEIDEAHLNKALHLLDENGKAAGQKTVG
jgi:Holliday junction resolvasome RuvABC ATP-dependent DNA helicase subunit